MKTLVFLAVFLFLSCAEMTTAQKQAMMTNAVELLRIGMTIAQATGIMGTPFLTYENRAETQRTYYKYETCNLVFEQGKLIGIIPAGKDK